MPAPNRPVSARVLRLALPHDPAPDADLLAQFLRDRDEAAFAALVERHGPIVLGVCRRMLRDAHAAEDAFQAVFLALIRDAARVRRAGSLAAWLYGAAVRVAIKARRSAARARSAARRGAARPPADPLAEVTGRELVAAIDEELARLPEQPRAAVVLCCLEGLSQEEAARRLGWSAGSVKGRLERGRERLRLRLARRGIALSAGLGGVLLGDAAPAVPPALFGQALELAAAGEASPAVAGLAAAASPAGPLPKLAAVAALALAVGGVAAIGTGEPPAAALPGGTARAEPVAVPPRSVDRFGDPLPDGAVLRLGTTRLRHAGVFAVAFTPDNTLLSFGADYTARAWDPATGRLLRERAFEKSAGHRFWGGCFAPDGRRLAVQLGDRMKVFDVESGRELASVKLGSSYEAMARFSPDGKLLAVVDQDGKFDVKKVQLCDVAANTCRDLCRVKGFASEPAFSRDGRRLALAEGSPGVGVWEVTTGRELLRFKPEGLIGGTIDFDPTGDVLAVLGAVNPPQAFHFVRVSTGRPPDGWTVPPVADFGWVRFAPDGSSVLLGGRKGLRWCDPKTGKVIHTADGWAATPPAFSPDGRLVASARQNEVRLWDAASGRPAVPEYLGDTPQEEVHGVSVSPDGSWILTKDGEAGTIRVWDTAGRPKGVIKSNRRGGRYPLFSPDGRHLFGVAPDSIALVRWDFPGGAESARYAFAEPAKDQVSVYHFGLSADGRRLAALTQTTNRPARGGGRVGGLPGGAGGEVATLTVWDAATARRLESREVEQGNRFFGYGAFSPDLRWYFSGDQPLSADGGPVPRLELPVGWSFPRQAAVSPDGRLVAQVVAEPNDEGKGSGTEWRCVVINEAATGKQVLALATGFAGPLAFTPDGRGLVVTDPVGIARWDLASRKPVVRHRSPARFTGSYGNSFASSLTVAPDGTRVVTGHIDTTALVWDLPTPPRPAKALSDRELAAAWEDLAGGDARKAYTVIWAMADAGEGVVPFLRARLRPAAAPPEGRVRELVARLDAPAFADREAAEKELRALGDAAAPALRALLKSGLSAEQAGRIGRLLAAADAPVLPPGERLRQVRAVAVLEWAGTAGARTLLGELAGGAVEDRLTRETAAAVERLRPRPR